MLSLFRRSAKNVFARLSSAANRLFRHITQPARPSVVTGTLADLPRSRTELLAENALLRQRLTVLHHNVKTPCLRLQACFRLLFLARSVSNCKQVLQIIKPDTLSRWIRAGFHLFWRFKSRVQTPSNRLEADTISLRQRMPPSRTNRIAPYASRTTNGSFLAL
jgi:putative transposase